MNITESIFCIAMALNALLSGFALGWSLRRLCLQKRGPSSPATRSVLVFVVADGLGPSPTAKTTPPASDDPGERSPVADDADDPADDRNQTAN